MKIALLTADIGNPMPNIGDFFITHAIERLLVGHDRVRVPLHQTPTPDEMNRLRQFDRLVVCGTNLIGPGGTVRSAFDAEMFKTIGVPVIPLGLGSQADLGQSVEIDRRGRDLLNFWYQSTGLISVRDSLTSGAIAKVLGEGRTELTGCPSLTLSEPSSGSYSKYAIFSPGPYHYEPYQFKLKDYRNAVRNLGLRFSRTEKAVFLAQQALSRITSENDCRCGVRLEFSNSSVPHCDREWHSRVFIGGGRENESVGGDDGHSSSRVFENNDDRRSD